LSNCGDILTVLLPNVSWKRLRGQVNSLWYGENAEHEPVGEMDNPQPSPKAAFGYWMQFTD
jgi:hypothetical protein